MKKALNKLSLSTGTNNKLGSITSEQLEKESIEMQLRLKSIQDKVNEQQLNGFIKPSSGSSNSRNNNISLTSAGKVTALHF